MTARRRFYLVTTVLMSPFFAAACDLLMTEPAPADGLTISFQVVPDAIGGTDEAFAKVRRVFLRFTRPDAPPRDTVVSVVASEGVIRTGIALPTSERIDALGIAAQLGIGTTPLFEGATIVQVVPGTPTTAEVILTPVPARIEADPGQLTLQGPGASGQLASTVLYATGDTIEGLQGVWLSEDPTIVSVSPAGLAIAQRIGQTRLEVRLDTLADTVQVEVVPAPTRLKTWASAAGGSWSDPTNWSGGVAPIAGDSVRIVLDGTYTITLGADPGALAALTIGGATGSQVLAVNGPALTVAGDVAIGGTGSLELTGTALSGSAVSVGASSTLTLRGGAVVSGPVTNAGLLLADEGNAAVTGAVTTAPTSTIRVADDVFVTALSFASGFANTGRIELGGSARLTVSTGTLINTAGATLATVTTLLAGGTFLTAEIDNRGSVALADPLTVDGPDAAHRNSGSISSAVGAILTVTGADAFDHSGTLDASNATVDLSFTGTGTGFTTSGPITVQSGAQFVVRNGPFTHTGSTITGTGVVRLVGLTGTLGGAVTLGTTGPTFFEVIGSSLSAPGVTVPTATVLVLQDGSTLTGNLNVQGQVAAIGAGTSTVDGSVTTAAASQINIQGGSLGSPVLAFTNTFTNNGSIILQNSQSGMSAGLTVIGGTLANGASGTISSLVGAGGGTRTINADVATVGAITLTEPLTINGQLIDPVGAPSTYTSNGSRLFVTGLDVDGPVFNNMPLSSSGGSLDQLANVTFVNMDPTQIQLALIHPGAAAPFTLNNLSFAVPPTTGAYMSVTDSDGLAPFLTVEVLGSSPASGSGLSVTGGGAVLIW